MGRASVQPLGAESGSQGEAGDFEHRSVLLGPVLDLLKVQPGGVYVDGTLGAGGYSEGILRAAAGVTVVGIDRDPAALEAAEARLAPVAVESGGSLHLVHGVFSALGEYLDGLGLGLVQGIVLDLGVSSPQLDVAERGFSFMLDGPLDMRMDPTAGPTAAELVALASAEDLAQWFWKFGEERHSRAIAKAIVKARERAPLTRTTDLARVVEDAAPRGKGSRRIHPATRVFQALRIAVNCELYHLNEALPLAVRRLAVGGRLAVVSFHSLEDRIVKQFMKAEAEPCTCPPDLPMCVCGQVARMKPVTRRAVVADEAELELNPRSRSAKLRVSERVGGPEQG